MYLLQIGIITIIIYVGLIIFGCKIGNKNSQKMLTYKNTNDILKQN